MNNKNKMRGISVLLTLSSIVMIATSVQAEANESTVEAYANLGAGIALGLAGIGTGSVSYTHLTLPTILLV